MVMEAQCFDTVPSAEVVGRCTEVYAAAFEQAPYFEEAGQARGLKGRIEKYQERDGFIFPVMRDAVGDIQGFALAVIAHPGDWWRDHAAAALGDQGTRRWLGAECLEIVHVAVSPLVQRRGLGRQLMATLESQAEATTGVLSCHPQAAPARHLYLSMKWQILTKDFRTEPHQLGYWLMAKDLN